MEAPAWRVEDSPEFVWASTWSERHAAYAAGLGTFGLCDGLITPKGKAMRAGSVVAKIDIAATERPYTDHHAYCLFYANGTCGLCIDRCPVGALSEKGHDKVKCKAHLDRTRPYVKETYGFEGYGCGLCQVDVPCGSGIPAGIGDRLQGTGSDRL
jgi:epoxyqueuosine reductase QueG